MDVFGYDLVLEKGDERIPLSQELEALPALKRKVPVVHRKIAAAKQKAQDVRRAG